LANAESSGGVISLDCNNTRSQMWAVTRFLWQQMLHIRSSAATAPPYRIYLAFLADQLVIASHNVGGDESTAHLDKTGTFHGNHPQ